MSSRLSRGLAACAAAMLPFLANAAPVREPLGDGRSGSDGPAFSRLDPDRSIRGTVDRDVSRRIVQGVQRDTRRGEIWTETLFSALGAVSAEITRLDREGRLAGPSRHEIGALAVIAVLDAVVAEHPELEPALNGFAEDLDQLEASPVERICSCDRSGSKACGCSVLSTGPGECNYKVQCPTLGRAFCSAVNLEMCVAESVMDIVHLAPLE